MRQRNIPSEEEFDCARAAMRQRDRGLSDVRARIVNRFRDQGLHDIFVFYSQDNDSFVAHVFYERNDQLQASTESGFRDQIKHAIIEELECVGRGDKTSLKIDFIFDSHENVEANFEGDYYLRLR